MMCAIAIATVRGFPHIGRSPAGSLQRQTDYQKSRPVVHMARPSEATHPNQAAFPRGVSGPALRALASAGVRSVQELSQWREADLVALHGMGPKALTVLTEALKASGGRFRGS